MLYHDFIRESHNIMLQARVALNTSPASICWI
jgi:hypothetical protein